MSLNSQHFYSACKNSTSWWPWPPPQISNKYLHLHWCTSPSQLLQTVIIQGLAAASVQDAIHSGQTSQLLIRIWEANATTYANSAWFSGSCLCGRVTQQAHLTLLWLLWFQPPGQCRHKMRVWRIQINYKMPPDVPTPEVIQVKPAKWIQLAATVTVCTVSPSLDWSSSLLQRASIWLWALCISYILQLLAHPVCHGLQEGN